MGQSAYARLEEDNFSIEKNKHNIIRLVADLQLMKTLTMKKSSQVLLYVYISETGYYSITDTIKLNCI